MLLQIACAEAQRLQRPVRDARIECLPLPHDVHHRLQCLFQGCQRVVAVTVEQVHIVRPHPFQALVDAGHEIFAAAPVAVGPRPHVVARLRGDEELVAVRPEVVVHQPPHRLLGRSVHRPVVVGKVEVGDAVVEGVVSNLPTTLVGVHASEVMPEAQAHPRQHHTRAPAALIHHLARIAVLVSKIIFLHIVITLNLET